MRKASFASVVLLVVALVLAVAPSASADSGQAYIDDYTEFQDVLPSSSADGQLGVGMDWGSATVSSVDLSDAANVFTLDASECIGATIDTTGECLLRLRFMPLAVGNYQATVTVSTTVGSVSQLVSASSSSPFVHLWVPETVDFGIVPIGESATQRVFFSNSGNIAATVSLYVQNDRDAFFAPQDVDVPAHGSSSVALTFTPTHLYGFSSGLVWSYGGDAWVSNLAGVAYSKAGDNQQTAASIVGDPPFLFQDAAYLGWQAPNGEESPCGMSASSWYKYTAPMDSAIQYAFDSDVDLMVGEATTNGSSCGGPTPAGSFSTTQVLAGQTVYLFAGTPSGQNSGNKIIYLTAHVQPLVHVSLTLNNRGKVDKRGTATISGTASVDPLETVIIHAIVKQKSGHGFITAESMGGYFDQSGTLTWTMSFPPTAGKFVAGQLTVEVDAFDAVDDGFGTHPRIASTVKLSGG